VWFPDARLLRVGLSQHGLTLVRGARPDNAAPDLRLDCAGAPVHGQPWRPAVDQLAQWLAAHDAKGLRVSVVLSGRFVRWQLLPWREELSGVSERASFAALRFREVFGLGAGAWDIRPASLAPGHTAPAAAIDQDLVAALQTSCQQSGAQLQRVTPYFSSAFDHWRSSLQGSPVWFGTLESDSLTLGLLQGGAWLALQTQRLDGPWQAPLRALMAQMAMASGLSDTSGSSDSRGEEPAPLYLAGDMAPPAPADGLAFHWLAPTAGPAAPGTPALPGLRLAWGR
jgi:hypothetical protein